MDKNRRATLKVKAAIGLIVALLTSLTIVPAQAADTNAIPDPVFRATINQLLGRGTDTPITKDELGYLVGPEIAQGLYSFPFLANRGIKNFEGIQYLNPRNIFFDISGNAPESLAPIAQIPNLWFLQARDAQLTSLAELSQVSSLQGLIVDNNQITSLEPLKNNANLSQVSLANNQLTSLNGLENLTGITDFNAEGNQITDYSGVAKSTKMKRFLVDGFNFSATNQGTFQIVATGSNLKDLSFMQNWENMGKLQLAILKNNAELENLKGLENATKLSAIQIDNSPKLADLSGLENSSALTLVVLNAQAGDQANQALKSLKGLAGKPGLTGFQAVNFTALEDISALKESVNLVNLKLDNTALSSLDALENMTKLNTVEATNSKISDLSGLAQAKTLENLVLDHNQISDLSPLAELSKLYKLSFNYNQVKKLQALAKLSNLHDIYAMHNQIDDLTGIPVKVYGHFFFDHNQITDVSPIKGVRSTNHIDLGDNQIADISPLSLSANDGDPNGDTSYQWVFMPRQRPVIPINLDASRTITVKNPLRGFTSSAWDQLLHPNDPNHQQEGEKAAKVLPYNAAASQDDSQWGWEKYAAEYPGMTVSYNEAEDTITFSNIPLDATEVKYDFSKSYWTGSTGRMYTPFSGTVHFVINNLPVINASDRVITEGSVFDPLAGVSAEDKEDGPLTLDLTNVIENLVQETVPGTYTVTYQVSDSKGATVQKTVQIRVNARPVITASDQEITVGDSYDPLAGVSAEDREDGSLKITLDHVEYYQDGQKVAAIDTSKVGEYTVVYQVVDKDGASATKSIRLQIKAKVVIPDVPVVPNPPSNPESPVKPEQPGKPGTPSEPNQSEPKLPVTEAVKQPEKVEKQLSNTGSSSSLLLGLSLTLLGVGTVGIWQRRAARK